MIPLRHLRFAPLLAAFVVVSTSTVRADAFDHYTNPDLAKAVTAPGVEAVTELTAAQLAAAGGKLPGTTATMLILKTRDDRFAKLLVQPGLQKIGQARHPMLLIERFITFKDGEERMTVAKGAGIQVYGGLEFSADLGQVVPVSVGGDLIVVVEGGKLTVRAEKGAKLFLVKTAPKSTGAAKGGRPQMGDSFESRFFIGSYKLYDDGRRSGSLTLDIDEASGDVTGTFYSDKDGRKYDVKGKIGSVRHAISFSIKLPQTEQQFTGHLFTGDGNAIAGTTKLQDREAGFYAVRIIE